MRISDWSSDVCSSDLVESALMEHPDVDIAVVIGIPHEDMGSVPHAIVRCRAGVRDLDETLLREFVEQRLARSKTPKSYEFTQEDLRDDAGKVRRGEQIGRASCRERVCQYV